MGGIEQLSLLKFGSIFLSVAGAVVVIMFGERKQDTADATHKWLGIASLIINVICGSTFFVLRKEHLRSYSAIFVTAMTYAWSMIFIFVVAVGTSGLNSAAWSMGGNRTTWLCAAYAVCFTTALNYSILG